MVSILVADDDPDILELICFKLLQMGHDVITAVNGPCALLESRSRRFALAILDVGMPGLSGLDVTRSIRSDPVNHDIPIMLLSAHVFVHDVAQGYAAGADDYVTKPFSPVDLGLRVTALIPDSWPVLEPQALPA